MLMKRIAAPMVGGIFYVVCFGIADLSTGL